MIHAKTRRREDSVPFATSRLRVSHKTESSGRWIQNLLSRVTRLASTLTRRESTRTQLLTAAVHALLKGEEE
ncbi:MAG: hypothetical protein R3C19_00385 [Planctomycetaceae bacterium]